ncbi:hypothetical protein H2O64_07790 [Kordia sp. YSTF-M3]|uniref:Bacteriocin n=1 Tax=Kordia aestuariivivens TaxID=2759037 RepID=A0ABR7Q7M5_9FLAO|nr:hypothetical protein [Kordia aestuariivivens]MBC8754571.1 hypothetical protein [Kordia aestuariivivens]
MKKQFQIKKLVLSKKVIGNLTQISGGRPPNTHKNCDDTGEPSDDGSGFTSHCSVIVC